MIMITQEWQAQNFEKKYLDGKIAHLGHEKALFGKKL